MGENIKGYYRFPKGFYGPADIPTLFQKKIDRTLGHQTPVWLDDITIVTRGIPGYYIQYFANVIPNLSEKTDNLRHFFKKGTKWD